jgi:hypothetical protein
VRKISGERGACRRSFDGRASGDDGVSSGTVGDARTGTKPRGAVRRRSPRIGRGHVTPRSPPCGAGVLADTSVGVVTVRTPRSPSGEAPPARTRRRVIRSARS